MFLCTFWEGWGKPIIQNVLGGWAFISFLKLLYFLFILLQYLGKYYHSDATRANNIFFYVRCNPLYILLPIPNMKISILKKENGKPEWKGIYYSDMLSIYSFKGLYEVFDKEHGANGWHEIHLLKEKDGEGIKRKIALNIHFLCSETKKWDNDGGYFIEKIP